MSEKRDYEVMEVIPKRFPKIKMLDTWTIFHFNGYQTGAHSLEKAQQVYDGMETAELWEFTDAGTHQIARLIQEKNSYNLNNRGFVFYTQFNKPKCVRMSHAIPCLFIWHYGSRGWEFQRRIDDVSEIETWRAKKISDVEAMYWHTKHAKEYRGRG